jgi:DNA replication protein DnaC
MEEHDDVLRLDPESIAEAAEIIRKAYRPPSRPRSPDFWLEDLEEWLEGECATDIHYLGGGLFKIHCWDMERYLEKTGWRFEKVIHYPNNTTRIPPSRRNFRKDSKAHDYWAEARAFVENEDGIKMAVWFDMDDCSIALYSKREEEGFIKELWEDFRQYHRTGGILKRAKFNFNFNFIQPRGRTWSDVKISSEKKAIFTTNVVNVMHNMEAFIEAGLKTNRGLILCGPPGTGKTLTTDALVDEVDETVIYVTTDTVTSVGEIKDIYSLARSLAPTLVIFEDIDALGGISRQVSQHPLLAEFLDALDGIQENAGVVTIASTNHPEMLDWALVDRPGRFDIRIDYDYPNTEFRIAILDKFLSVTSHDAGIDLSSLSRRCEGLSGAHLQEIVSQAGLISYEHHGGEEFTILEEHLDEALNRILYNRARYLEERQILPPGDDDSGMVG